MACGWLRDGQVATRVDVRRETIRAWRQQPHFRACVEELEPELGAHVDRPARAGLEPALTNFEELVDS